jgi:hypothetical protein
VKTLTTYVLTDPVLTSTSLTTTKSLELIDSSTTSPITTLPDCARSAVRRSGGEFQNNTR